MDKFDPKLPKRPRHMDGAQILHAAALILQNELLASHEAIQRCIQSQDDADAARLMRAAAAMACALVKLKGENRQRIVIERPGEGGGSQKSKNE